MEDAIKQRLLRDIRSILERGDAYSSGATIVRGMPISRLLRSLVDMGWKHLGPTLTTCPMTWNVIGIETGVHASNNYYGARGSIAAEWIRHQEHRKSRVKQAEVFAFIREGN